MGSSVSLQFAFNSLRSLAQQQSDCTRRGSLRLRGFSQAHLHSHPPPSTPPEPDMRTRNESARTQRAAFGDRWGSRHSIHTGLSGRVWLRKPQGPHSEVSTRKPAAPHLCPRIPLLPREAFLPGWISTSFRTDGDHV